MLSPEKICEVICEHKSINEREFCRAPYLGSLNTCIPKVKSLLKAQEAETRKDTLAEVKQVLNDNHPECKNCYWMEDVCTGVKFTDGELGCPAWQAMKGECLNGNK